MNCKLWITNLCEKSDINGLIGRMELQEYYNAPEAFPIPHGKVRRVIVH
ncbi:hypothetical protein [Bacteroides sp.]|nr:hypothetical protein [Bacteroides sp.]